MFKTAGLLVIAAAAAYMAWLNLRECRERLRLLSELKMTFAVLRTEISRRLVPLPEALEKLSREQNHTIREFYSCCAKEIRASETRLFSEIWSSSARTAFDGKLRTQELETLERLGLCLGKLEAREQEREILKCEEEFEQYLSDERTQGLARGKIRAAVSVCAGIAVMVLVV